MPKKHHVTWHHLIMIAGFLGMGLLIATLASCGNANSGSPGGNQQPDNHAYLYSSVDYPRQITVRKSDTVKLTLSTDSGYLTLTPSAGHGAATVGSPISLPTDLANYRDISVQASVQGDSSPIIWQLTSAQLQSLFANPDSPAPSYRPKDDPATFTWNVTATATGQNTTKIVIAIYYKYRDNSIHQGTIEASAMPIPILAVEAVEPSLVDQALSHYRLPAAGLMGFASVFGFLRFIWGAYQTVTEVANQVKGAKKAVDAIRGRQQSHTASDSPDPLPPTLKRRGG
jgi:hypothetical protein